MFSHCNLFRNSEKVPQKISRFVIVFLKNNQTGSISARLIDNYEGLSFDSICSIYNSYRCRVVSCKYLDHFYIDL